MDEALRISLVSLSDRFLEYLETLRNKNPLKGSEGGKNANSVFVEIGKNLVVDTILADIKKAKNPQAPRKEVHDGSEIMSSQITI